MKKTVRLTEDKLTRIVEDAIKQITSGGDVPVVEVDVPANRCVKKVNEIIGYLKKQARELRGTGYAHETRTPEFQEGDKFNYPKTKKLYTELSKVLEGMCETLESFMESQGYDRYLRKMGDCY